METLSPESFELLKLISEGLVVEKSSSVNHSCIEQLEENGLIESHICDYCLDGSSPIPVYSNYAITEKGKGYLSQLQNEEQSFLALKSIAESAKEQAKSAKIQSDLAVKSSLEAEGDAKRARRSASFSNVIAVIAVLVAIMQPFLSEYASRIIDMLLKLFSIQ